MSMINKDIENSESDVPVETGEETTPEIVETPIETEVPQESETEKHLKIELEKIKKELEVLKNKTIMKATAEGPVIQKEKELAPTVENMLKLRYGIL